MAVDRRWPAAIARHARAHHLVVMEGDATRRKPARARLADVVEQRGEPHLELGLGLLHHRDGVREHVLVTMDGILLEIGRAHV